MKKLLIATSLVLSLNLVGCSSNNEETVKEVPMSEIQTAVNTEELLAIQPFDSLDAKDFYIFQEVIDNIEEGFVTKAMINVKLQDVFVIKTDDVDAIKAILEQYKENELRSFADGYGGEENITAVSESILSSKGDYVYFIAAPNATEIEQTILDTITQ